MLTLSLPVIIVVLLNLLATCSAQKNITVASSSSELQYSPNVNTWTDSNTCPGGYHYISRIGASVSLDFVGVAVYIVSSRERPGGLLTVQIDGKEVGSADRYADLVVETCGFVIFGQGGLPFGPHKITVTHQGPSVAATGIGYIALQNFIYTSVDPPIVPPTITPYSSSPSSSSGQSSRIPLPTTLLGGKPGADQEENEKPSNWKFIVGGIAAAAVVLGLALGVWLIIRRRNAKKRQNRRVSLATLAAPVGRHSFAEAHAAISPYTLHSTHSVNSHMPFTYPAGHQSNLDHTRSPAFLPSMPPPSVTSSHDPSIQKFQSPTYPPSSPAQWSAKSGLPEKSGLLPDAAYYPPPQQPAAALTEPDIMRIATAVARITQGDGSNTLPHAAGVTPLAAAVQQYNAAPTHPQQPVHPTTGQGPDVTELGPAPPAYSEYRPPPTR